MYGVNATVAEAAIDEATTARFGYEPQHLMVYRAAYALITSNCFSPSGSDGHFEWCIRVLPAAASSLKLSNSDINRPRDGFRSLIDLSACIATMRVHRRDPPQAPRAAAGGADGVS